MAIGGSFLPLLLWLGPACLAPEPTVDDNADVLISAPPHLTELIPEAATATVEAGYTPSGSSAVAEENHEVVVVKEEIPVMVATEAIPAASEEIPAVVATSEEIPLLVLPAQSTTEESATEAATTEAAATEAAATEAAATEAAATEAAATEVAATEESATEGSSTPPSPGKLGIMIVGDTHYQWQQWSPWHCNCEQGSMSRVRDITYSVPGVVLDPAQYDVLRFQRVVCDYKVCHCLPEEKQCDRLQVTCDAEEEHICALRDIEKDQRRLRKDFWARLHEELKNLWQSLKEAFPRARKESKAKRAR